MVSVYEDGEENKINSTNVVCLEKDVRYNIVVENKSESLILYDFYISGYDINEEISIKPNETILYTYISDKEGIYYFESDLDLEIINENYDILLLQKGKIYNILVTNNKDIDVISNLELKEPEEIDLDDDGVIQNDSKYVKLTESKGIYQLTFNGDDSESYFYDGNSFDSLYNTIIPKGNFGYYFETSKLQSINRLSDEEAVLIDDNVYYNGDDCYTFNNKLNIKLKDSMTNNSNIKYEISCTFCNNKHSNSTTKIVFKEKDYKKYEVCIVLQFTIGNKEDTLPIYINVYYLEGQAKIKVNKEIEDSNIKYTFYFEGDLNPNSLNGSVSYDGRAFGNIGKIEFDKTILSRYKFNINWNVKEEYLEYVLSKMKVTYVYTYNGSDYTNGSECTDIYNYNKVKYEYKYKMVEDEDLSSFTLLVSVFEFEGSDYSTLGISTFEQLEYALTYFDEDSFSYSDEINSDIQIYSDYINRYSFVLLNDIDCKNRTIKIAENVIFIGELNGDGHTISNLNIKRVLNSNTMGIFAENYGYIHDIKFKDCLYDLSEVDVYYTYNNKKMYKTMISFLCPSDYGTIENVELISVECKYKDKNKRKTIIDIDTSCNYISFI